MCARDVSNRRVTGARELTQRWSALHHDIDPHGDPMLSRWLRLMWAGGRALDRAGVPPTTITAGGLVLAAASVMLAGDHPITASATVVGAALCDGLDGATAVVGDRATRAGALADAVADRLCDGAFAIVLWRRAVPAWAATTAAALAWGVDALRRARGVPARITIAERPTFTVCAALACATDVVTHRPWPARLCAAVWIGAGLVGMAQVARTPRR